MTEGIADAVVSATSGHNRQTQAKQASDLHRFRYIKTAGNDRSESAETRDDTSDEGESPPSERERQPDSFAARKVIIHTSNLFPYPQSKRGTRSTIIQENAQDGI